MRRLTFETDNTKTKRECKVTWYATGGVFPVLYSAILNKENAIHAVGNGTFCVKLLAIYWRRFLCHQNLKTNKKDLLWVSSLQGLSFSTLGKGLFRSLACPKEYNCLAAINQLPQKGKRATDLLVRKVMFDTAS